MILVDTSIWIDHFRRAAPSLAAALADGHVGLHPFVLGELTLGSLPRRSSTLALLATLPCLVPSAHDDVLAFVDRFGLVGSGVGWVDVHLLCAAHHAGWDIWSHDRRFIAAAKRII